MNAANNAALAILAEIQFSDRSELAKLRAAKDAGYAAYSTGAEPQQHPQAVGCQFYEAWYDGWDRAQCEALTD